MTEKPLLLSKGSSHRAVYVFEFSNGTAYVGLSYNIQRRYRSHVTEGNSPVYNYIRTRPNIKFQFRQLSEYISPDAAAKLEIETIRDYRTKGWSMLNTLDGGGLGAGKRVVSRFFGTTEEIEPMLVKTDLEVATDDLQEFEYESMFLITDFFEEATDDLQKYVEQYSQPHIKYDSISRYLKYKDLLRNGLCVNHFISNLQRRKIIGTDIERTKHCTLGYKIFRQKDI